MNTYSQKQTVKSLPLAPPFVSFRFVKKRGKKIFRNKKNATQLKCLCYDLRYSICNEKKRTQKRKTMDRDSNEQSNPILIVLFLLLQRDGTNELGGYSMLFRAMVRYCPTTKGANRKKKRGKCRLQTFKHITIVS